MAKNSQIYSANNPYGNRDEEIRKAKGNPNKNIHAKKKNSNYGGYNGAAEKAHKAAEEKSTLNKLPTWMKVTLIVDIVVIVVLLILRSRSEEQRPAQLYHNALPRPDLRVPRLYAQLPV